MNFIPLNGPVRREVSKAIDEVDLALNRLCHAMELHGDERWRLVCRAAANDARIEAGDISRVVKSPSIIEIIASLQQSTTEMAFRGEDGYWQPGDRLVSSTYYTPLVLEYVGPGKEPAKFKGRVLVSDGPETGRQVFDVTEWSRAAFKRDHPAEVNDKEHRNDGELDPESERGQ